MQGAFNLSTVLLAAPFYGDVGARDEGLGLIACVYPAEGKCWLSYWQAYASPSLDLLA